MNRTGSQATPTVGLEPTATRLRALRLTDWARRGLLPKHLKLKRIALKQGGFRLLRQTLPRMQFTKQSRWAKFPKVVCISTLEKGLKSTPCSVPAYAKRNTQKQSQRKSKITHRCRYNKCLKVVHISNHPKGLKSTPIVAETPQNFCTAGIAHAIESKYTPKWRSKHFNGAVTKLLGPWSEASWTAYKRCRS